jgi:hypothetical protein
LVKFMWSQQEGRPLVKKIVVPREQLLGGFLKWGDLQVTKGFNTKLVQWHGWFNTISWSSMFLGWWPGGAPPWFRKPRVYPLWHAHFQAFTGTTTTSRLFEPLPTRGCLGCGSLKWLQRITT